MTRTTSPLGLHTASLSAALVLLALVSVLLCGCSTTSIHEEEPATPVNQVIPAKLAIVHTGGVGGAYARQGDSMGIASVAALAHKLEDEGYEVLLLDSGDSFVGSPLVNLSDGEVPVAFMNAAGYDALTLGYAELSLGLDVLKKRTTQSDFTYLSANVKPATKVKTPMKENMVVTLADGRKVGIFGLSAPDVTEKLGPATTHDFAADDEELKDIAHEQVAALRSEGCRLVICLANLGTDDEGTPRAQRLASSVSGINVLLDVSSGGAEQISATDASGDKMLVVETAPELSGTSVITWETGKLSVSFYDAASQDGEDEQVEALVNQTEQEASLYLGKEVATAQRAISLGNGSMPSGLAQLATDAILWEADRSSKEKPVAAVFTASQLKATLPQGSITNEDVLAALPHISTKLCTLEVRGSQLQAVLAPLLAAQPTYHEATPYIAGIELVHESGQDGLPAEASIEKVGGVAFSPTSTYVIATCEGLIAPSGPLYALTQGAKDPVAVGSSAGKALSAYLDRACKGEVPERYLEAPAPEAPAPDQN